MYKLIQWNENLNLDEFYAEAARRGFENNSSQNKMIDCLKNEREWAVWILYKNQKPIGSVAAHSFDEVMGPGSYRICVRTCSFAEAVTRRSIITINKLIIEHQNLTAQFFMPQCIKWSKNIDKLYITSHDSKIGTQRLVHKIYFPTLEKIGIVNKSCEMFYRGNQQTIWHFNASKFLTDLKNYPRWT